MTIARRFTDFLARLRSAARDTEHARLAAILEMNRGLAAADDRRALLTLLIDEAVKLFRAERGFLVLAGPNGHSIEVARSLDREPVKAPTTKVSSTLIARCLETRQPLFLTDAQEGDFAAAQSVADLQLRSVLCVPLIAAERLLGCLYLDHRFHSAAFTEADLPWLQAFADQGAIALHLHRLIDENRERSRALERTVVDQARELSTMRDGASRDGLRHDFTEILGDSPALARTLHLLDRVTDAHFPVLLIGESGTGKELFARALHREGPRRTGPFVAVNVGAVQPALFESELFGHRRGAYTGADRDRRGLLRESDGGVVFLDEITEIEPEAHAKLLRVLEDGVVRPVGSDQSASVDVRIVAATNRDPRAEVEAGRLRHDLYYRLAVVTIDLPPLRERKSDIPLLVA